MSNLIGSELPLVERLRKMKGIGDYQLGALMDGVGLQAADEIDRLHGLLRAVVEQAGRDGEGRIDAPGHCHDVPGVWDSDNGELAGKPCAWCAIWNEAKDAAGLPANVVS